MPDSEVSKETENVTANCLFSSDLQDKEIAMTRATKPFSNRIAIILDFDSTLVPDTLDSLLESLALDPDAFRQSRIQPLIEEGWDKIPARFYALIEESRRRSRENKITKDYLANFGRELQPFPGVREMFGRLRQRAYHLIEDIEIEFYLVTGGFVEIARHTCIANQFKAMWGCEFHYADSGEIQFLKQFVTHTEKTRYLYGISKGIDGHLQENPLFIYQDLPQEELYVPFSQMIYVGDGVSDMPCFAVMNQEQGTAIGVCKGTVREWNDGAQLSQSQRVANLALADYSENSELMRSLTLAVEGICKQIALHQLSVGE
jgi:phosphoglycolate phosphatase-like HAD superfamily hydrolase